jgi:formate dehydrogenase subunit gamma
MAATTSQPRNDMATSSRRILRFDRTERYLHWTNATLFLILLATGAALKMPTFEELVGRRALLKEIHVYTGLVLPIPVLLALVLPAGRQFRRDIARFNRWTDDDRRWWHRDTKAGAKLGKFNPGQKLNAVFIGASIIVMLGTGIIMRWPNPYPNSIRTGAEFVHDATFLVLVVVIVGHIFFALSDQDSLQSMLRGSVPESWAKRERPRWWAEMQAASAGDAGSDVAARGEQRVGERGVGASEVTVGDAVDGGASDGLGGREL